jgi:hypothetical protein
MDAASLVDGASLDDEEQATDENETTATETRARRKDMAKGIDPSPPCANRSG